MNIAFYFTNKPIEDVNCKDLSKGNPGIGGTYYEMLLLCYLLTIRKDNNIKVFLFAESTKNIPSIIDAVVVSSLENLNRSLNEYDIDILVCNKIGDNTLDKHFFNSIKKTKSKVIVWAHCFISNKTLNYYAKNEKVARVIAVGKEEMLTWCDHKVYRKADYIYNICEYPDFELKPFCERGNNVVYIGSIVPLKGLHLLTSAWPKVIEKVNDANLYIIGGGNLYNNNARLGSYGIAEYFYEKKILKPIIGDDGRILQSVHFCGVMGAEKFSVLNEAKVGVPNPSGLTETFGITAVEMQLAGNLITTKKCPGYLDTVDKTNSILYDDPSHLANCIVNLLQRKEYDPQEVVASLRQKFSASVLVERWRQMFEEINNNILPKHKIATSDFPPTLRKLKNRRLQEMLPFLPSLMLYEDLGQKLGYVFNKIFHLSDTIKKIYIRKIRKQ